MIKKFIKIQVIALVILVAAAFTLGITGTTTQVSAATLTKPASVKCTAKTYNSATIKWSKVKNAKSYVIYKAAKTSKTFKKVKVVKAAKTQYKVTKLSKGTTYKFIVKAAKTVKGTGEGKASKTLSITTNKSMTYTISPKSKPCNPKMLRFGYYNKKTAQYYTIRSYMEKFEKSGGGTLVFKAGTYTLPNTIFVPSNVTIIFKNGVKLVKGFSTGSSLKTSSSMFHLIRPSKGFKKNAVGKYNGEKNIHFIGQGTVTVDMKYYKDSNCIQTGHNTNVTVENMSFKNEKGGHFIEMDATKNGKVINCKFNGITGDDTREAINLDTPDKATGGFTAVWSNFDKTANNNITIDKCKFSNMGRSVGTHNYSYNHPHKNIKITNCTMSNMRSYAIGMMYWQGVTIKNNKMTGTSTTYNGLSYCGILGKGVKKCTISGNTIDNYYHAMMFKPEQSSGYAKITNALTSSELSTLQKNNSVKRIAVYDKKHSYLGLYYKSSNSEEPTRLVFKRI